MSEPAVLSQSINAALDAMAPETRRAYTREFSSFRFWCDRGGISYFPAKSSSVEQYVDGLCASGRKPAGISLAITAIGRVHELCGFESPCQSKEVRSVRARVHSKIYATTECKAPLLLDALLAALAMLPQTPIGTRDRALLLLGWAGGFRRSEIVGLDLGDVLVASHGIEVHLAQSKTDQEGEGQDVDIYRGNRPETCPVRALEAWLALRGSSPGPLFVGFNGAGAITKRRMCGATVAKLVKRAVGLVGLDASSVSSHSMRRGMIHHAIRNGESLEGASERAGHGTLYGTVPYLRGMVAAM